MEENDTQENDNFEFETDPEQAVEIAPNPAMNGTTVHQPVPLPHHISNPGAYNRKVTEVYSVPMNPLMNRINSRAPFAAPKQKEKDDRDFLDTFNVKAESSDYMLSCTRTLPTENAYGDPVPSGDKSKHVVDVMSYDDLYTVLSEVWGGGLFRVSVIDRSGRRAENVNRAIFVNIPTTQHPPKREKNEKIEAPISLRGGKAVVTGDTELDELKILEKEARIADRRAANDAAAEKREYDSLKRKMEMAELTRKLTDPNNGTGKSSELAALEKRLDEEKRAREEALKRAEEERKEERRLAEETRKEERQIAEEARKEEARQREEDRKEAQRQRDEDRRLTMEGMTKLGESIRAVAERPAAPPPNILGEVMALMAPVLTAFISRPVAPPPDNKELILAMSESQRTQMQLMTTALAKPPDNSSEKMFEAMIKLTGKQDSVQQAMITGMLNTILEKDKGQTLTPELLLDLQDRTEKRFEKLMGMSQANAGEHAGEDGDSGYDPALGFMGNAGKAIFSSLKALVDSAATNPQLLELVAKLVGNRNPSEQQLMQAAYAMEQQQSGMPPAMAYQAPVQNQLPTSGYAPINQQAIPYNPNGSPPIPRSMPPSMPPPQNVPPTQVTQQQSIANELESASTGLPGNGDPEQAPPLSPEELAEENLVDAVTRTVEIMVGECVGKPAKRTWPEDATDNWNRDFIKKIVDQSDEKLRIGMIGQKCNNEVAIKFNNALKNDQSEMMIFWNELRRFVQMNAHLSGNQPASQPVQSAVPPVNPA